MNTKIFEVIPDFDVLLEKKSFEELSEKEKTEILRFLTAQEYSAYRNTILESKELFQEEKKSVEPDIAVKENLIYLFEKKRAFNKKGFLDFLYYRIPVYKISFAVPVLVIIFLFFNKFEIQKVEYIKQTDTVFTERIISSGKKDAIIIKKERFITQNKSKIVNKDKSKTIEKAAESRQPLVYSIGNSPNDIEFIRKMKKGRPINDDSVVYKLLMSVKSI